MFYLRADLFVRPQQHSELWCDRRTSERRAELAHAIPSEEEEDEVKLTNKDAEERTKDLKGNTKKEL